MPFEIEIETSYLGKKTTVRGDSLAQVHEIVAGIDELNADANFLAKKSGSKNLAFDYRQDDDENDYYGVSVKGSRESVTFGKKRGDHLVPFFPKGEEGYYNPSQGGGRRGNRQAPQRQRPPREERGGGNEGPAMPDKQDGLPF